MRRTILTLLATLALGPASVPGQSFRRGGTEFDALRPLQVPADAKCSVVVTEFLHHGEIGDDGRNVIVTTRDQRLVPVRVLQVGPGDFCRLAFQTVEGQSSYEILYGGRAPDEAALPPWTDPHGLVLETRQYQPCNLNRLDSVREEFESSKRIGSDYVDGVQHSHNPFALRPAPFLSRYRGTLHVGTAGVYGFFTSSQDCSFLLIDGKVVAEAPGRHGPERRARPGLRRDVHLAAGAHEFEYYHAASGPAAMMVAAWEVAPTEAKPQPKAIPPEAFRAAAIGRFPAGPVTTRTDKLVPDFLYTIAGDVPLPDNELALLGVRFTDVSPEALTLKAKVRWEFGDGQTSEEANPFHVYLRPGVYPVKLSIRRGPRTLETTNRVQVDRPAILKREEYHEIDQYLPVLATYDLKTLDVLSLRQLVLAYQFKAETILAPTEGDGDASRGGTDAAEGPEEDSQRVAARERKDAEARRAEAMKYVAAAVDAGEAALTGDSSVQGSDGLIEIARLVGPMARHGLGDSARAGALWLGAAKRIVNAELKAECEVEAADVALNDLLDAETARSLLDAAAAHLRETRSGKVASRLHRVWGDYHARAGDAEAARRAYRAAESALVDSRSYIERTAWRGAHSRSTEQFLQTGDLERAAAQLDAWQDEFPADKIDGYLNLALARYRSARGQYAQAIALMEQQLAIHPDSPHVDQLMMLAADCEIEREQSDRALAVLNQLVHDYPGSPLVAQARDKIKAVEAGEAKPSRRHFGRPGGGL